MIPFSFDRKHKQHSNRFQSFAERESEKTYKEIELVSEPREEKEYNCPECIKENLVFQSPLKRLGDYLKCYNCKRMFRMKE